MTPSQTQKPVIKAEGAGHSGPTFKPDNAEYGLLGRDPKGWGHLNAHLCYEPLIWPAKPHDSRLAARPNDRQRRSRAMVGRSLQIKRLIFASLRDHSLSCYTKDNPHHVLLPAPAD
ncbi:hypothetical protein EGO53_03595 [Serratia liquefaciens]|uniref:Uncharacterized protein n=1 Tax=Serratia liquefaciens TaxID=614 RepID=A0A515CRZ5_SERLI|nr:hypothetical protein EGO53_03595 [Serratia liquefaciens]